MTKRVIDIARELGISWQEVCEAGKSLGMDLDHHANAVEPEQESQIAHALRSLTPEGVGRTIDENAQPDEAVVFRKGTVRKATEEEEFEREMFKPVELPTNDTDEITTYLRGVVEQVDALKAGRSWHRLSYVQRVGLLGAYHMAMEALGETVDGKRAKFSSWLGIDPKTATVVTS